MIDEKFNERLTRRRRQMGLTQKDLERRTGASQAAISGLERGKYPRAIVIAIAVARELDTSVEYLFGALAPASAERRPRQPRTRRAPSP